MRVRELLLRAAILLAASLAASADGHERVVLPAATHADLASGRADATLRAAFLGADAPGAMLVRGIPGYETARIDALETLASCARSMDAAAISDGVLAGNARWDRAHGGNGEFTRRTLAAETSRRVPAVIDAQCGDGARQKLEALRAAADAAARAALPRLDDLLGREASAGFFADAVRADASLDHFHVYRRNGVDGGNAAGSDPGAARAAASARRDDVSSSDVPSSPPLQLAAPRPGLRGKGEHTDVGVAVVMTPALLVADATDGGNRDEAIDGAADRVTREDDDRGGSSRGLTLGGRHPILPPDAVLVMLGEGARAWYPDGDVASSIAVPTHEMSLSSMSLGSQRAWFGRMVFPAPETRTRLGRRGPTRSSSNDRGGEDVDDDVVDDVVDDAEMTFGEWRRLAAAAFSESGGDSPGDDATSAVLAAAACGDDFHEPPSAEGETSSRVTSRRRRRVLADDASCALGEVYCWHACVPEPPAGCAAGTVAKCVQPGSNKIWPENFGDGGHCSDCVAWCVADPPSASASSAAPSYPNPDGFCNVNIAPISMYMDGFAGWSDPKQPCVAFLHRDAALTTPWLMVCALACTVAMGTSVEYLASVRRWRVATQDAAIAGYVECGGSAATAVRVIRVQILFLYLVQVAAGYLLMLISMTYHAVLFAGVVGGLVLGHAMFNVSAPVVAGGASACCQHVATPSLACTGGAKDGDGDASISSIDSGDAVEVDVMNGHVDGDKAAARV